MIDDNLELLRQMAEAFARAGYDVQVAADGQTGLSRFEAAPPDLVVTDIIMPNREGIETILSFKRLKPEVKVIAISGGYRAGPTDFLQLAKHVGADGGLAKPFRPSALLELAASVLQSPAVTPAV